MVKNMETKKEIRARALKERRALPSWVRHAYDREILRLAAAHPFFQNAREIYCYASFRDEVSTFCLMEEARKAGKRVAVPCVTDGLEMEFCYIESLHDLQPGYCGIPEPDGMQAKKAVPGICAAAVREGGGSGRSEPESSTAAVRGLPERAGGDILMILPGAAFDRKGNRIGYGKGFYDRYLQYVPQCRRMGLAYSVQCVEDIPAGPWDIPADIVITEKGNYVTCGMNCQRIP